MKPEPKYLYRYRAMDSIDLDRIFTHNELYFASPNDVNDPFDCAPPLKFIDCSDEDYMILHNSGAPHENPDMTAIIKSEEKKALQELKNNRIGYLMEREEDFRRKLKDMSGPIGVLCLSATPDDILMWSHYADKHTGIVLQFDRKALYEYFNEQCYEVDYKNNSINVKTLIEDFKKWHIPLLIKKSKHWCYEEEWRVLVDPNSRQDKPENPRIYKFPKEILTGIILGSEITDPDRDRVIMWRNFNNSNVKIYEAKKDDYRYKINIFPSRYNSKRI